MKLKKFIEEKQYLINILQKIGKPLAFRAVANACAKNPLPIIIPCHRVIKQNGKLVDILKKNSIKKKILLEQELT